MMMSKEVNANCEHEEISKYVFDLGLEDDIVESPELKEDSDYDNDDSYDNEDEEEEEEEEEPEDEEVRDDIEEGISPLDSVEDSTCADQFYEDFVGDEYETLARKKRKPLVDRRPKGSVKKGKKEDAPKESLEEQVMEFMAGGGQGRRSNEHKKRGRGKWLRRKCSLEVARLLSKARFCYAFGDYKEAIPILKEVIKQAPNFPDGYEVLGQVHSELGDKMRALNCYQVAAVFAPKNPSLWIVLFTLFIEIGNVSQASACLSRALSADPEAEDIVSLKLDLAALSVQLRDYERAAALYEEIVQSCPDNVKALMKGAEMYEKCGQCERAIHMLEEYLRAHPTEADFRVIDLLTSFLIENRAHNEALQHIEHAQVALFSGKELPLYMTVKTGICYAHLGNMEKAAILFTEFAARNTKFNKGFLHLKIARCYVSLNYKVQAIFYFYQALKTLEEHIEARLSLASILLDEAREDEAILLLSPPKNRELVDLQSDEAQPWWCDGKVKLKLYHIYRAKGMHKELVDAIYHLVHESLCIISLGKKLKRRVVKKEFVKKELLETDIALDDWQTGILFAGNRSRALPKPDHQKVNREKKWLQEKAKLKEEKRAAAMVGGDDWKSDDYSDSDDDDDPDHDLQELQKEPPLPDLVKDKQNHCLILDLCKSLAALNRHLEALEIIKLGLKSSKGMSSFRGELRFLGAQIAYTDPDPEHGLSYVKYIADHNPNSIAVWNCYYKVITRQKDWFRDKHDKFVRNRGPKLKDYAPPNIISGHHYTGKGRHHEAAREYLQAYKLLPENPLVNLCAGTSLINLAAERRLQNKHHCVAQGLAFLYNNFRSCENSQEACYNIARAFHQVGLVTLAVFYYEKVLEIHVKYPIPNLPHENSGSGPSKLPGYCDLRREAGFNLHLIYKKCGSFDLARQVLRDYCTF